MNRLKQKDIESMTTQLSMAWNDGFLTFSERFDILFNQSRGNAVSMAALARSLEQCRELLTFDNEVQEDIDDWLSELDESAANGLSDTDYAFYLKHRPERPETDELAK